MFDPDDLDSRHAFVLFVKTSARRMIYVWLGVRCEYTATDVSTLAKEFTSAHGVGSEYIETEAVCEGNEPDAFWDCFND